MYSGTTFTPLSGRILGAHQKIDRTARHHLRTLLPDNNSFPSTRQILHFEGGNGPDAIKRKSPAKDEPWHYFDPFDDSDTQLLELMDDHYRALVEALKTSNNVRAAFEAAWLAHALVDGLTPAHHYPYEQKLAELRGQGKETRISVKDKLILPGNNRAQQISNNWKMWGPKGLFTTHSAFEMGIATLIAPLTLKVARPKMADLRTICQHGPTVWFRRAAREIAALDTYEMFYTQGWTTRLARLIRHHLAPTIVQTVTVVWYSAAVDAGLAPKVTS